MKNIITRLSLLFFLLFWLQCSTASAQPKTYSFEEVDSLQKIDPRPAIIFIHTSWCSYCAAMKNTSWKNKKLVKLINDKFYFISFNAEEKRSIFFNGYTFNYKPTGHKTGVHELALELGYFNGALSFPTVCFLNSNNEIVYQQDGYLTAKEITGILSRL